MRGSKIFLWLALFSAIQGISQTKKVSFGLEFNHYQISRKITEKVSIPVFDREDGLYDSIFEKRKNSMIFLNPYFQFTKNKFSHKIGISLIPVSYKSVKRDTFLIGELKGQYRDKQQGNSVGDRFSPRIGIFYGNELNITEKLSCQWGLNLTFFYLGKERPFSGRIELADLPLNLGFSYSVTKFLKANFFANLTPYNLRRYNYTDRYTDGYFYINNKNAKNISANFSSKFPIQLSFGLNYIFATKQANKNTIQPNKTYQF